MSVVPWSPLEGGFLTGKYASSGIEAGAGRLSTPAYRSGPAAMMQPDESAWRVLDVLLSVAAEVGATPSAVALRWLLDRPAVTSVLVGARTAAQLTTNLAASAVELTPEQASRLEEAGRPAAELPYAMFGESVLTAARERARATVRA
jgi:aryl-alcohol dehydrogenase-like predicted oxidoreductase